jgi:hypothetical protein
VRLSDQSKQKIAEWFQSKIDNHICQTCGEGVWGILDDMWMLSSPDIPPQSRLNFGLPVIVVQCQNCATLKFFNPLALGIDPGNP